MNSLKSNNRRSPCKGDTAKACRVCQKFAAATKNVKVVLYEGITPGAWIIPPIVQKIKQSGAKAVNLWRYHPEAASIVSQMRKKGMKTIFISDDGVKDITLYQGAGKNAEVFMHRPQGYLEKTYGPPPQEAHKKTYGSDPGAFY